MAKFEKTKKLTGTIDKSATIVSGGVLDSKQVKREVGDPEEFKKVVKNYVRNYDHIDNISVYKFNRQYFVVIGNAYKKNIENREKLRYNYCVDLILFRRGKCRRNEVILWKEKLEPSPEASAAPSSARAMTWWKSL